MLLGAGCCKRRPAFFYEGEGPPPGSASLSQQIIPRTTQGASDPSGRRQEDVDLPGLDTLHVTNVQVHLFGQFLLGEAPGATLTADTLAELLYKFLHWERHNGAISATDRA